MEIDRKGPEYRAWIDMRHRCLSPKSKLWSYYGGRGITICERWDTFEYFLKDMGLRPRGRTLERIKNHLGYSPHNCKWATWKEQAQNRRNRVSSPKGEENGASKLTVEKVKFIRDYFKPAVPTGFPCSAKHFADMFEVSVSTVYRRVSGQYWKEV